MCNADTLDFLEKCLDKDPGKRWTCEQLLRHQYFENFSFKTEENEIQPFEKIARDRTKVQQNKSLLFKDTLFFSLQNSTTNTMSLPQLPKLASPTKPSQQRSKVDHLPTI